MSQKIALSLAPELASHAHRVCSLYKRACRNIEAFYVYRPAIRYHQVQLRNRFDERKSISDEKEQRKLLWLGEEELFLKQHPIKCMKFARSPAGVAGGVAWERVQVIPDWVLDYWHPLEKARYPFYFKLREQRKCEYIKLWNKGELY